MEVTTSKFQDLNSKYRSCYDGDNYSDAEDSELGKLIKEEFGCTSPFIDPKDRHGAEICRDQTKGKLVQDFIKTSAGTYGTNMWKKKYFMPPPCTYNTYSYVENVYSSTKAKYLWLSHADMKEGGKKNKDYTSLLLIYFYSKMEVTEQFWAYTFVQYIAEIGGYVGLFLGYSLLQIGEVLQYIRSKVSKV